ncbi:NUDIX domain-containing protein [Saccharibacter sp. EH611]|nr:NUDIX domain-containing protein [Saccharibacter sp. EH611]MXV58110.1 NUDIX domain-containing protein [Saccharibacter sp. EH70]MXV65384.1 NUDIX domain-containing protein [Saccharibacter sp. EH60]
MLSLLTSCERSNVPTNLSSPILPFLRCIQRCHNASLPQGRLPFYYGNIIIGWLDHRLLPALKTSLSPDAITVTPDHIYLNKGDFLRDISLSLAEQQCYQPFNEWFDVTNPEGENIGQVDRGLIPLCGFEAAGVHLNGMVKKGEQLFLWVAKRSKHKRLDPGKLDHLVAGGMSSGLTPDETVVKEAGEEAAISPELARTARHVSTLRYAMIRPEGLRRDRLYCYDLLLSEEFQPRAADGEVESFHLMPLQEVFHLVQKEDQFKFNVNLVLIDLFIRYHLFSPSDEAILSEALYHPI